MNARKITFNILVAFFVFPLVMRIKYWIDFGINPVKKYESIRDLIANEFFHNSLYIIMAFSFLILILLPYQLIKDVSLKKGKKLTYIKKTMIFTGLIGIPILLLGAFSNIWWIPWYKNFLY